MNFEQLGKIRLYNADCMEVMKGFKDKQFDLAIVDVPYGIKEHGQRMNRTEKWKNPGPIKYKRIQWDNKSPDKSYFDELIRISKNQIIWGANHFISKIPYDSSCWIVWDKKTAGDFADCELAWTSFDTAVRKFDWLWSGFRKEKPQDRIHPTEKPIKIYSWLLQNYAKEGDTILDTHFGSLSIGIACHDLGFELTAIELDKEYYEKAKERLIWHQKQTTLF